MTKTFNLRPPLSTTEERMKHTPKDKPGRGHWNGPRGNSTYIVDSKQKFYG